MTEARTSINIDTTTQQNLDSVSELTKLSKAELVRQVADTLSKQRNALAIISAHSNVSLTSLIEIGIQQTVDKCLLQATQRQAQQASLAKAAQPVNLYLATKELAQPDLTVSELAQLVTEKYPELASEAANFSEQRSNIINQRFSYQSSLVARATQSKLYVNTHGKLTDANY